MNIYTVLSHSKTHPREGKILALAVVYFTLNGQHVLLTGTRLSDHSDLIMSQMYCHFYIFKQCGLNLYLQYFLSN